MNYFRFGVAGAVVVAAALLIAPGGVAAVEVFRCDLDGGVMYTDAPCKGGLAIALEAGSANPESLKRLEETRKALEQSADRRLASVQQDAERKAETTHWAQMAQAGNVVGSAPEASEYGPNAEYAYGPVWYAASTPARPRKHRHPASTQPRHIAPSPPYAVPRS